MINRIEFSDRNLTLNAGLLLLLEHASKNGGFDLIDHDLVFENASTNKIKMNHIKTMLCGNFIGSDKLERLKLLQSDPLVNEFAISIKEPEMVSRFLGNFSFKTTQMLRERMDTSDCFWCSRWTSQGKQNTGSRSRPSD